MAVKRASVMGIRVRREVLPPIAREDDLEKLVKGGERRKKNKKMEEMKKKEGESKTD